MLIYFTMEHWDMWPLINPLLLLYGALLFFCLSLESHHLLASSIFPAVGPKQGPRHWILSPIVSVDKKWWEWWTPCSPAGLWTAWASSSPPDMWDQLCKSHWREFWEIELPVLTNPFILQSTNIYWAATVCLGMCDALGTRQERRHGFIHSGLLVNGKQIEK